ncbi:hypothetical protein EJ02DRAFT_196222 [Clathrospora elynae]|uniref:Uncharacterized protein n=1 Tax=Clathrospora elynae TaxID=706981 RepID=A0A6A5T4G1_9PLEO|nr:hypothetical protein EJ02DRAFT_196222 [Clathrospora elynae]
MHEGAVTSSPGTMWAKTSKNWSMKLSTLICSIALPLPRLHPLNYDTLCEIRALENFRVSEDRSANIRRIFSRVPRITC